MRIYFVGAHSSGKSTLARYVSEKYNLSMISETARMILSEQELQIDAIRCDLNTADKYQKAVFDRQIIEEQKYTNFVSDRSAVDILAYSAQHTRTLPSLMKSKELSPYIDSLNHSDVAIFFVRPSKATMKADGIRESLTWDGVVAIDAQIKLLLEIFSLKYFQISTDSMQERIKIIDNIISILINN